MTKKETHRASETPPARESREFRKNKGSVRELPYAFDREAGMKGSGKAEAHPPRTAAAGSEKKRHEMTFLSGKIDCQMTER